MKRLIPLLLLISAPALAQDNKLLVAASSSSGTYSQMLKEITQFCSTGDLTIEETKTEGGATANLAALANNKASAAFLHSDVIFASAQSEPKYKELKTLVALYPEEVHVLTLRSSKIKKGGTMGFGAKTVEFGTLADLKGYKVGAAGGGAITARVLQGQGEIHYDVVEKGSGKEVMAALDSGEIQAAIFVGGAPLHSIESLSADQYKLLPIPEAVLPKVQTVYRSATINYGNLQSGPIRTLSAEAIILTRKYKSPRMVAPQRKFRSCFYKNLDDLKETPGLHPKWQMVEPESKAEASSVWEWYQLDQAPDAVAGPPPSRRR